MTIRDRNAEIIQNSSSPQSHICH